MKTLGIDYGTKNIGLSLSDPLNSMAFPYDKIAPELFFSKIENIIIDEDVSRIVLGKPMNMKGQNTKMTETVIEFKTNLETIVNVPVFFQDERLTSMQVDKNLQALGMNTKKRRQVKDALEATQILQQYLDTENAKN